MIAVLCGLAAGAAYPFIDLAIACRVSDSEACVWGKAYLKLTIGLSFALLAPVVAAGAYFLMAFVRRR